MTQRLFTALFLASLLIVPLTAKDKNKNQLPEIILRAQTARVVIDPDAGEPLDQPHANAIARDNVERALTEWGRFRLTTLDSGDADLIIVIRTGDDKMVRPTIKGGPIDQRPGVAQSTDSSIRIGGQQGHPPTGDPSMDPYNYPQDRSPHVGNEVGPTVDSFLVYQGGRSDPLDSSPLWRYMGKDGLKAPQMLAVEQFRKAVADAEKPKVPKKP